MHCSKKPGLCREIVLGSSMQKAGHLAGHGERAACTGLVAATSK